MKYFTPELYIAYNSPDDAIAARTEDEWMNAMIAYKNRLTEIQDELPQHVRELARMCFHDAEVLSFRVLHRPNGFDGPCSPASGDWSAIATIALRQDDTLTYLSYWLATEIRKDNPPKGWEFATEPETWLYDEIDKTDKVRSGGFKHRILFGSGITLEIPFVSVLIDQTSLSGLKSVLDGLK